MVAGAGAGGWRTEKTDGKTPAHSSAPLSPNLWNPHPLPKLQGKEAKVQARLVRPARDKNNKQEYSLSFSKLKTHFLKGQDKRTHEIPEPLRQSPPLFFSI